MIKVKIAGHNSYLESWLKKAPVELVKSGKINVLHYFGTTPEYLIWRFKPDMVVTHKRWLSGNFRQLYIPFKDGDLFARNEVYTNVPTLAKEYLMKIGLQKEIQEVHKSVPSSNLWTKIKKYAMWE